MSEEFALQQARWNRRAFQFYEWVRAAVAEIVNCPSNQFLPRTRVSTNKNSRTRWSHRFDLMQHLSQSGAIANDLFEVHLTAQLPFEVKLLLRELVGEFRDLTIGQRIVNGDCYLSGDLRQEFDVRLG